MVEGFDWSGPNEFCDTIEAEYFFCVAVFLGEANFTLDLTGDFSAKEVIFERSLATVGFSSFFAEPTLVRIFEFDLERVFPMLGFFGRHLVLEGLETVTETIEAENF